MIEDGFLQVDDAPQPNHLIGLFHNSEVLYASVEDQEEAVRFWLIFHEPGRLLRFQLERLGWTT